MATEYAKGKEGGGVVRELARATGVAEGDVGKVLDHLGFSKIYSEAAQANRNEELRLDAVRVAFKVGKNTVVV